MEKTFADIHVGDKLYWGAIGMDHVADTLVTDIHLELDGEYLPSCCDVYFKTNESFEFGINKLLLNKHNCVIFTHQVNGNEIYIGTSVNAVAKNIIRTLDEKINFWQNRKDRFISSFYDN